MKKRLLIVLLIVMIITLSGCGSSKKESNSSQENNKNEEKRTYKYLLDEYVLAYTKSDLKAALDLFPPYYIEYAKNYLTQEYLDNALKESKEKYGDDFNITYQIGKETKLTDEELKTVNTKMKDFFKTESTTNECYKYEGLLIFKGSKSEVKETLATMGYCKYDNNWYLVRI
jgi:uncharacterized protein YceK